MTGPIVVVGAGSIGQRHIRNLRALGVSDIVAVDPDGERREQAVAAGATASEQLEAALDRGPSAVLVCTPPHMHPDVAHNALSAGAHLFIEKPIAASLEGVDDLLAAAAAAKKVILVGYNLRFHAGVKEMKAMVDGGVIGRLLAVRAEFGQYLPDWRPGRDFRAGYNAFASQGGGIVADGSHEIDYVRWLAGEVRDVAAMTGTIGDFGIDAEDIGLITLRFADGALGQIHLDSLQRGYARSCRLIGATGTLIWEFRQGLRHVREDGQEKFYPITPEPNEMYLDEMAHFIECIAGTTTPLISGADGRRVLEIVLAAKRSSAERREVSVA